MKRARVDPDETVAENSAIEIPENNANEIPEILFRLGIIYLHLMLFNNFTI